MGLFNTILTKLGIRKEEAPATTPEAAPAEAAPVDAAPAAVDPAPIEPVDVVTQLEALAETSSEQLNWKTSIVDLLKLLSLDSSLASRKELATELACPAELMGDSAQMNMWLHKTVLQKLAENGGNIPAELL